MERMQKILASLNLENTLIFKFISENFTQLILVASVAFLIRKYLSERSKNLPPGPIGLPFVGYLPFLGAEPHKTLLQLSKKYGNIISLRLGSKLTIVLNDYDLMKDTLSHPAALDRAPYIFSHIPKLGFITENGEEWVEQRRVSIHLMRDLGLGRGPWESLVMEEVTSFLEMLSATKGSPVDVSHRLSSAINNNILSLLIGRRLQRDTEKEKIQLVVDYADVSFTYMGPSNVTSLIPGLRKYFKFFKIAGYDRAAKIITDFAKLICEEIAKHKSDAGIIDFISMYLDKKEGKMVQGKKHYFSDDNLEGAVKILFLGASDTIYSSLGWLFRLMAEHQDIQKKVQNELDDVIGREGRISYEERFRIPYTFSVLMEAQRVGSIVPLSTTRVANADFEIQGYTIPKGTEIFANLWALHFDPKYWPEPEKFKPERYLGESKHKFSKTTPSYVPFSIGRRNCPGETVAWMEILVFFTTIMQRFTIKAPPGIKPKFDYVNGLVAHLKPQELCFIERIDNQ